MFKRKQADETADMLDVLHDGVDILVVRNKGNHRSLQVLLGVASLVGLIVCWEIAYRTSVNYIMPSPRVVLDEILLMCESKELWQQWLASMKRLILGYAVGSSLGFGIGILIGMHKSMEALCYVFVHVFRHIPGLAWIPLAVLWLGIGIQSSVFVIALAAFFPLVINVSAGFQRVNRLYKRAALSLGVKDNSFFMLKQVIIPGSVNAIFSGLRIALAASWGAIVAAEMVAAASGLGFMIQYYRMLIQMERVVVAMVLIGITGYVMDSMLKRMQHHMLRYLS